MSTRTNSGLRVGVVAGLVGVVLTIVLYWVHLIVFGQPFVTSTDVWVTVLVSAFFTGWVPFAIGS